MNVPLERHIATIAMVNTAIAPITPNATVAILSVGLCWEDCADVSAPLSADVVEFALEDGVGDSVGATEAGISFGADCGVLIGMCGVG